MYIRLCFLKFLKVFTHGWIGGVPKPFTALIVTNCNIIKKKLLCSENNNFSFRSTLQGGGTAGKAIDDHLFAYDSFFVNFHRNLHGQAMGGVPMFMYTYIYVYIYIYITKKTMNFFSFVYEIYIYILYYIYK